MARTYNCCMAGGEKAGLAETRSQLLADAHGDVLEVGAGTGLNLPHYPADLRSLTVTDPDAAMLRRLERAVEALGRPVTALQAPAEDLPFEDTSFDTVVATLVLCSVGDQSRAVRELRRVLRPGGRLLFLEHVRSDDDKLAHRQDRMNWVTRMLSMCECNRPTLRIVEGSGLLVEDVTHGDLPKAPSFLRPMIVGRALRPTEQAH
jgi:ubiquinone/menaquinone biosynthesis C-methylase UbiE